MVGNLSGPPIAPTGLFRLGGGFGVSTLTMVRTVCCEGHQIHGKRCSLCPHRPENREAVENYKLAVRGLSLRRALAACDAVEFSSERQSSAAPEAFPQDQGSSRTDAVHPRNHPAYTSVGDLSSDGRQAV